MANLRTWGAPELSEMWAEFVKLLSTGHVAFVDREARVIFTGDHLLSDVSPSIAVEPLRPVSPLADYLGSLHQLRNLPDMVVSGTVLETARKLGWTRRRFPLDDLDVFNQVHAVGETAAHLDVLVELGRLRRAVRGHVVEYRT